VSSRPARDLPLRGVAFLAASLLTCGRASDGDWTHWAGDAGSRRASDLGQIDRSNVDSLGIEWIWSSVDDPLLAPKGELRSLGFQATPIAIDGTLYLGTSLSRVAAIDGESGETLWVFDPRVHERGRPPNWGFVHRGVAFWSKGRERRIFHAAGDGLLYAIDARTGALDMRFGERHGSGGWVDVRQGLPRVENERQVGHSSPPVVWRDVVIVGSSISDAARSTRMPPGQVRGYQAETGELLWTFDLVPEPGRPGSETWEDGASASAGSANAWAPMSVDAELGTVYFGTGTPSNDFYGGHRPGDNLYAESIVCLRAATGELVWSFQTTRHGLWDYDLPAAPILVDLELEPGAEPFPALVQLTKQGFAFVLDRRDGKPLWPIEERPVPASRVPGERASPTQPFPTRPPPFERQGVSEDDLLDFTPELRAEALAIAARYRLGPLYEPPVVRDADGVLATLQLPGTSGGANWGGGAVDPETAVLYVPSITSPISVGLVAPDASRSDLRYLRPGLERPEGPDGLPLLRPPYGRITAIDLRRGEILWQVPNGDGPRDHPRLRGLELPPLGQVGRSGPLLLPDLLFVAEGTSQTNSAERWGGGRALRAFDRDTGAVLWTFELPASASGVPMTFLAGGRQLVVVAVSEPGEPQALVALALPR
jgi:quinoprotein glucose dehydrogenase